jgi:hypothetical protein
MAALKNKHFSVVWTTDMTGNSCDESGGFHERSAMSVSRQLRKHELECLRLQADCMQLAGDVCGGDVQSHFVRMARFWVNLAASGPSANVGSQAVAFEEQTA